MTLKNVDEEKEIGSEEKKEEAVLVYLLMYEEEMGLKRTGLIFLC